MVSNQCVQAADCPSVSLPPEPPAPPAPTTTRSADPGVHWVPGGTPPKDPDNYCYFLGTGNICISSSQYAACSAYEFMGNITCPMGTVCCYKTNLCDYASSCPGQ
ncbi:hypothetical protein HK405_003585 [Cladochytrium tenue]|nr:hypothetical protein HK405_003585 [Cladochytrium tenue]